MKSSCFLNKSKPFWKFTNEQYLTSRLHSLFLNKNNRKRQIDYDLIHKELVDKCISDMKSVWHFVPDVYYYLDKEGHVGRL